MPTVQTNIEIYADRPRGFWAAMGPFFASKAVRKELPYLADDTGYIWFLARVEGELVGFASLHIENKGKGPSVGLLHGLYVLPEHRQNGFAAELIAARLQYLREQGVSSARATCSARSLPELIKHGFAAKSEKGSYTVVEKEL